MNHFILDGDTNGIHLFDKVPPELMMREVEFFQSKLENLENLETLRIDFFHCIG